MRNLIIVVLMVAAGASLAQAQNAGDCVSALAPCTPYINMTSGEPPSACCAPLYTALNSKSTLTCVCSIYGNAQFLLKMKFNAEAALSLPMRCGFEFDLSTACTAPSSPAVSPSSEGPSSDGDSDSPTGAPGPTTTVTTTPSPSGSKNGASSSVLSGFAILGSFIIWASIML